MYDFFPRTNAFSPDAKILIRKILKIKNNNHVNRTKFMERMPILGPHPVLFCAQGSGIGNLFLTEGTE